MIPWAVAHQASLSMGFRRQEYWSGLSFPSPGALPDSQIESVTPALAGRFLTAEPPGKPNRGVFALRTKMTKLGRVSHAAMEDSLDRRL